MSYINIWPKMELAETVQIVVFGTETEFRSVFRVNPPPPKKRAG